MANHSSILAWEIPWTEEPGGLQSNAKELDTSEHTLSRFSLTLLDPKGCSPPSSAVHGILQARILEWVAMLSSRGSS